ncbi:MAG: glycosyltransferase [bacterium]
MLRATVIVRARNEARHIAQTLEALAAGSCADVEVLVADDASTDDTDSVARNAGETHGMRLRVLSLAERQGPAAATNAAARQSDADLLFFLDGDCVPDRDWIAQGIAAFDRPDVCAVEGAVYYANPQPGFRNRVPLNPFYNLTRRGPLSVPGTDYATGNFAVRRAAFEAVGGFNAKRYARGREDTDLGLRLRAHGAIAYNPLMRVTHQEEYWTFRDLLRNARRYEADVRILKDHGDFIFRRGPILHPRFLLELLCPVAIPLRYRPRSLADWLFVPQFYAYLLLLRLTIWRAAAQEGLFVL